MRGLYGGESRGEKDLLYVFNCCLYIFKKKKGKKEIVQMIQTNQEIQTVFYVVLKG